MRRSTEMKTRALALLVGLALCAGQVWSQPTYDGPEILEGEGFTHTKHSIPMPDGVELAADLFLPDGEGPFPVVFLNTPYGTFQQYDMGQAFARRGFATLLQNFRGQYGSEGDFLPFVDEIPDHLASLEWILAQTWSNGSVGLVGNSSQSYSAQLLASTGHPTIKTIVNISGLTDVEELFLPGGTFRLNTLFPWMQFFYLKKPIRSMDEWNRLFAMTPLEEAFQWDPQVLDRMMRGSVDTDAIDVPVLHITGWNDVVYRQSLYLYERLAERGIEQRLVVGPWMHNYIGSDSTKFGDEDFGPAALMTSADELALIADWLEEKLNDEPSEDRSVRAFVMGDNEWREFDSWPPESAEITRSYLSGTTEAALGPAVESDGALLAAAGMGEETTSFTSDPNDPVPTLGGVNSHLFPHLAGPRDQSPFAERDDVVTFTTAPLEAPMTLAGPQKAVLHVSSSAPDTDFVVKLIQLKSDGYARIIEDGVLRTSYRGLDGDRAMMEPGNIYRIEVDLGSTALTIPAGDRLQIHIASTNFPKYDRNPNTGEHAWEAAELVPAEQTIHHSEEHPSHLVLSTIQ